MKILQSSDWHINLKNDKKINKQWQLNRFKTMFDLFLDMEEDIDIHIIAGDIFDKAPNLLESTLFEDFANKVQKRTIVIPGNHEATKKGESFLDNYNINENSIINNNIEIYTKNTNIEHMGVTFQLFPYTDMQKDNVPEYIEDSILVTHIRGEIPPHISAEFDFEKLRDWKLILLGDIHTNMKYKDYPAYYAGSPMNVSFDRTNKNNYGVNLIDFNNIDDYTVNFIDLGLPKLLRNRVSVKDKDNIQKDTYNNVIYEVVGDLHELQNIATSDFILDKKIAEKPKEESVLDLSTAEDNVLVELDIYLTHNNIQNKDRILDEFKNLNLH